jgi:diadenosine tetraphosphate (Ap4A) HIT family hydrolase
MKVRLARTAGFCMGVRRVMELALGAVHEAERAHLHLRPLDPQSPGAGSFWRTRASRPWKDLPEPDSMREAP